MLRLLDALLRYHLVMWLIGRLWRLGTLVWPLTLEYVAYQYTRLWILKNRANAALIAGHPDLADLWAARSIALAQIACGAAFIVIFSARNRLGKLSTWLASVGLYAAAFLPVYYEILRLRAVWPGWVYQQHFGLWSIVRDGVNWDVIATSVALILFVTTPRLRELYDRVPALRQGGLPAFFGRRRKPQRADTDIHGSAEWMSMREARTTFATGGIILGEAYRPDESRGYSTDYNSRDPSTWGEGGKADLLRYDGMTKTGHGCVIAGPGGGKTSTIGIASILEWTAGSIVALDPSAELCQVTARARQEMGRRVVVLDPTARERSGLNPLAYVDADPDIGLAQIQAIAFALMGETSQRQGAQRGDYWSNTAAAVLQAVMAVVVYHPDLPTTLRHMRQLLTQSEAELQAWLRDVAADPPIAQVAELARPLSEMAGEQWSGVYGNVATATQWLSTKSLADLVSLDTLDPREVARGETDLYIAVPLETLAASPAVARVIISTLFSVIRSENSKSAADRDRPMSQTLFILDEVYQLGPMTALEIARDTGRKVGVRLLMLWQSAGQVEAQFGREGKRGWYDSMAYRVYAVVSDIETGREVSAICGDQTLLQESDSEGSGDSRNAAQVLGGNTSRNRGRSLTPVKVPLIRPEAVMQLRGDEQIVVIPGKKPLRCGRPFYFRRNEMVVRTDPNRYVA